MQPDEIVPEIQSVPPEGKTPSPLRFAGALPKRAHSPAHPQLGNSAPLPKGKTETSAWRAERRSMTGLAASNGPKPTPSRRSARLLSSLGRTLAPPNAPVRCIARYGRWYSALYSVLVRGGLKFGWNGAEKRVFGRPRPTCLSLSHNMPQFAGQHA